MSKKLPLTDFRAVRSMLEPHEFATSEGQDVPATELIDQGTCGTECLVRLARTDFVMPEDSDILFELDWMPDYATLGRAFTDLYGRAPKSPLTD